MQGQSTRLRGQLSGSGALGGIELLLRGDVPGRRDALSALAVTDEQGRFEFQAPVLFNTVWRVEAWEDDGIRVTGPRRRLVVLPASR